MEDAQHLLTSIRLGPIYILFESAQRARAKLHLAVFHFAAWRVAGLLRDSPSGLEPLDIPVHPEEEIRASPLVARTYCPES